MQDLVFFHYVTYLERSISIGELQHCCIEPSPHHAATQDEFSLWSLCVLLPTYSGETWQ
jgi:hypothetical protein